MNRKTSRDHHEDNESNSLLITLHLFGGLLLRIFFMVYGYFHDEVFKVKYTDVDYTVFTDGAVYLNEGKSPFFREGYRYTPLLAYLMMPNVLMFRAFGKVLFVVCDIIAGYLVYKIVLAVRKHHQQIKGSDAISAACIWIYNPLPVIISTRGSSDSIISVLVLLVILLVIRNQNFASGLFFGLVVHFKLYPVIYVPALYVFLERRTESNPRLFNPFTGRRLAFALGALISFALTTGFSYNKFGYKYLYEAWIYHFERKDAQHNFSIYFYLYHIIPEHWHYLISRVAFIPQLVSIVYFTRSLISCPSNQVTPTLLVSLFAQTFLFVSLNKVITSQYFLWYFGLFPLLSPFLKLSWRRHLFLLSIWLLGQGQWLLPAYLYEFEKLPWALPWIWAASILFLLINFYILSVITMSFNVKGKSKSN
ncbi:GPI mannosyltransferase 1 [Halotydeus destructor]|nr:GPI mannosyltransferase 1 [Halotydeus destructor]